MENKKEIILERGKKRNKKFGKITKITFPDKSKIYISKQGWTLIAPEKHFKENIKTAKEWGKIELLIPFSEINIAIQESIVAGYVLSNQSPPVRTSDKKSDSASQKDLISIKEENQK